MVYRIWQMMKVLFRMTRELWFFCCHCERSEAISIISLVIKSAILKKRNNVSGS